MPRTMVFDRDAREHELREEAVATFLEIAPIRHLRDQIGCPE